MNRDLWLRPHSGFDLTPAIIGENLADLAAACGCGEIPLPSKMMIPITPYGLLVDPLNGTRSTWEDGAGSAGIGFGQGVGGVDIRNKGYTQYRSAIGVTQTAFTQIVCADIREVTLPENEPSHQGFCSYSAGCVLHWGHLSASFRDCFFTATSTSASTFRAPKFGTDATDLNRPQTWAGRYKSSDEVSAYLGGVKKNTQATLAAGVLVLPNHHIGLGSFSILSGNGAVDGTYYHGAWWEGTELGDDAALTDDQIAALGGEFKFAITTPWQPQQYYYRDVPIASIINPRGRNGRADQRAGTRYAA